MPRKSELLRGGLLLLLRNLLLYFLLVNAYFQLRETLDLTFQTVVFLLAILTALLLAASRLRFLPSLVLAAAVPLGLRALFFLVFHLQRVIASGPATDFVFLYFDKDFFPALVVWGVAWLLNFLARRHPPFLLVEALIDAALLLAVFWSQAGYKLTLYPHPSIFAWALAVFIVIQIFALLVSGEARGRGPARVRAARARSVLSFAWIVVPLLLVFLLFLLDRYGEGAVKAGGGLMKPTLFRFDFAPYIRLESEIRTSDETVLLFRTEGKAERFLLRRFVLSGYEKNQGFFMERGKGMDEYIPIVPDAPQTYPDPGYRGRLSVSQEYYFITLDPSSLIALNYPVSVTPLQNWKSSSFLRVYRTQSRAIRSLQPEHLVVAQPAMPADQLGYYTSASADKQVADLAREITAGMVGYDAKVTAIERYLRTNYWYSLKPGIAEDGDQLHHFLFVSKKGYCSYFAFAMALMCRSLGIPARVAVGFYVDPQSEVLNFYQVRAFQAHAWVEVYYGNLGWLEFDPTSDRLAPGEEFTNPPGPDRERMAKLIAEILNNQTNIEEWQPTRSAAARSLAGIADTIARLAAVVARLWYFTLPILYVLYLVGSKLLPRLPGLASRDPRRRVKARYRLELVRLAGVGLARRAGESPLEHARRVEAATGACLEPLTRSYLQAAFGPSFEAPQESRARQAAMSFAGSYRQRIGAPLRVTGLLNPVVGRVP
ncbi:MAG TPA: transglutaminase domain-containing protein [Spirochaetia bacterium]|nr:transglutaminase domain-containing protein [Spirochaetia bacterium]